MNNFFDSLKRHTRIQMAYFLLIVLFLLALVMNINTGSVNISVTRIAQILMDSSDSSVEGAIIWKIRLPRLIAAAVYGGALSVSGFLLQTYFRNPIVGPFVLGISSGAKFFVGLVMILALSNSMHMSSQSTVFAAFAGSMLSMGLVLLLSKKVSGISMLVVVGIMIGYICSAATDFLVTFADEANIAHLTLWSMGSFSGAKWGDLRISVPVILISTFAVFLMSKPISAFGLGEGYAKSMGVNIKLFRTALILFSSLLSSCVTAFAGPVSFVGIAVPHVTRMLLKTSKPMVIMPCVFLCGAVFCMFADLIARTLFAPVELAIGTVTSFLGAPIVIWLMINNKRKSL